MRSHMAWPKINLIFLILSSSLLFYKFFYSYISNTTNSSSFSFHRCARVINFSFCPKINKYYKPVLSDLDLHVNISKLESHPNFSPFYLKNSTLSVLLPDVQSIRWTGIHWQESWRFHPKFLLYSAHLDDREAQLVVCNQTYVRVLAVYDGQYKPDVYSCQLWFNEKEPPVLMPVFQYDIIDWQGFLPNQLVPYLISCIVPPIEGQVNSPIAVSLVQNSCDSPNNILHVTGGCGMEQDTNEIKVENEENKSSTISVGVCGPALYYYNSDHSHRLVEWIETMFMVGASKVILYKTENHRNVEKVLQYYQEKGKLKIVSFRYPPPYVDEPSLRKAWVMTKRSEIYGLENIYFTDCVLRFKDEFQYLVHFDPDEIPVLKKHRGLPELIEYLKQRYGSVDSPASYLLKWRTFYPETPPGPSAKDIPHRFYMLSHNRYPTKVVNTIDINGKSIFDTSQTVAVFAHQPLIVIKKSSKKTQVVESSVAYTAHFRYQECNEMCSRSKFKEENFLIQRKKFVVFDCGPDTNSKELRSLAWRMRAHEWFIHSFTHCSRKHFIVTLYFAHTQWEVI